MFLPEEYTDIGKIPTKATFFEFKWESLIIPEYEFHKFLVCEFSVINKGNWYMWQYGVYFEWEHLQIYLNLVNDGIILEVWADDVMECGNFLQWIRNSMMSITFENLFTEYILIEYKSRTTALPYKVLEVFNSWGIHFYCFPVKDDPGTLIPIDVDLISRKCGLKGLALEDEVSDVNLLVKEKLEQEGVIVRIDKIYGNVNITSYEAH